MDLDDCSHRVIPAACQESLLIIHDGLNMPNLNEIIRSAAVVLLFTTTMKLATIHLCEKTNHSRASNFRGEIHGGMLTSHILQTIDKLNPTSQGFVTCYCDNLGVIHHANNLLCSLPEEQKQRKNLLSFCHQLALIQITWEYVNVQPHQDNSHSMDEHMFPQQLKVLTDAIAKDALTILIHT